MPNNSPQEEHLLYLERLDETRRFIALVREAQKKWVKAHFDLSVSPRSFVEGDLVLLYDQAHDNLGQENSNPCGMGPISLSAFCRMGLMS